MQLTGGALRRLEAITPAGREVRIDLTISDEWPLAQAIVVISAVQMRTADLHCLAKRGRLYATEPKVP